MTRNCPSCKIGSLSEPTPQKITVHFDNPGNVIFEAKAEVCNKCGIKLVANDDESAAAFDKAYEEQYVNAH